ncbi:MAG TPA: energy transducer TonB [Sphingomonadaceae bacterium]|nr:energy transducer TonB [Sphingomonadaceae bacterium]
MAAVLTLRNDERIGLGVAVAAHIALLVALSVQVSRSPAIIAPPERMVVSLAEEVAMTASAPEISEETQAALAPEISDRPNPRPPSEAEAVPENRPTPRVNPRTRAEQPQAQPRNQERASGAEFGSAFREGQSSGERNQGGAPADAITPQVRASLGMSITRQLRPNWNAPDGLEAELLRTTVTWNLNPDGSLSGTPDCQPTRGITDSNRPQAGRHCELAIRAIRKTAPFNLPDRYYAFWKRLTWEFNKDLSR